MAVIWPPRCLRRSSVRPPFPKAAAEVYAAEFEGEDMAGRIKSETGGFGKKWYGKWVDLLVEFDRDESGELPEDIEGLAKQLYDAGAGKWMGTDEQVFIDILCKVGYV